MVKSECVPNVIIMYQTFSLHKQPHRIIGILHKLHQITDFFVYIVYILKTKHFFVTFQYLNHALFAKAWTVFENVEYLLLPLLPDLS